MKVSSSPPSSSRTSSSTNIIIPATIVVGFGIFIRFLAVILSDGRYILDFLNRHCFPQGPLIVNNPEHIEWRNQTRQAVNIILKELREWEESGQNSFPEFASLTPQQYFPEADKDTYGKSQQRAWGFLWLRLYGVDTKLVQEFPKLVELYDNLPVDIISIGISKLDPGRGDVTHYGEFRGTWRQLLTIEEPVPSKSVRLGLYPYNSKQSSLCDSIWTSPDVFQSDCQPIMESPLIHEYVVGKDILFDDSVWHFIDNDSKEGRRVAIWVDVVRTDLNFIQNQILKVFLFVAKYLNSEVTDVVNIVNNINYTKKVKGIESSTEERLIAASSTLSDDDVDKVLPNDAPKGPIEEYNKSNLVDIDLGF